ncbi:substrate-binding periplasmic protein [Desulfonema magnum]|uniref:Extracellular solute-binding protein, family 3 n=1 Tax=Desulfonema magnum TaxID=45655 RepID=A0A975BQC5_9BACT|nr:ABC transporter substrate-binding protein [Desulfonema magnum]QTA89746.1 Extracellular solute-binding protein, family 3 [Desulfonema magnum]
MKKIIFALMIVSLTSLADAQEIKLVTENWPPMNYEKNGDVTGIATEIVQATLNKAGIKAYPHIYPWVRAYRMASEQKNVLIYTIRRTRKRDPLFKWICPLVPSQSVFLYKLKKRTDIVINSLEDAKKYTVGEVRGDAGADFLLKHGFVKNKNLELVARGEQNIKKLFAERITLILDTELSLAYLTKSVGKPFDQLEKAFLLYEGGEDICMAFSKTTPDELAERVRAAFEEVRAEGTPEAVMEKYLKSLKER